MSDIKPIRAHAVVDVETMIRAFRAHGGTRTLLVRFLFGIAGLVAIILAFPAMTRGQGALAMFLFFGGIAGFVAAVLSGYRLRNAISKQLKQAGQEHQEINYQISDSDLQLETKETTSRIAWLRFRKWKERDGLILIYRHDAQFIVIPIEQWEPAAQDALRARLREHVPPA